MSSSFIILISFLIYIITAINSNGFHHFDEHFQIFEFLQLKLGLTTPEKLPWEYTFQQRSWAQPFIYYYPMKLMQWFGVVNPFVQASFFRIITSLLGLWAQVLLWKHYAPSLKSLKTQKIAPYIIILSWFLPYIHARTSSGNLGGTLFIFGFILFVKQIRKLALPSQLAWITIGFTWGLSFLCRYQIVAMIAFAVLWAIIFYRSQIFYRPFLTLTVSIFLMLGIGAVIDYWGYGQWTFPFWNYVKLNLVEGKASQFGVLPFYGHLRFILLRGLPPLSLIFILTAALFWLKNLKHELTWITLPFFVIHSLIPHKEIRYLFPLFFFAPVLLVLVLDKWKKFNETNSFKKSLRFFYTLNICALFVMGILSGRSAINLYKYLFYNKDQLGIEKLYAWDENPYKMLGLPLTFYQRGAPKFIETIKTNQDLRNVLNDSEKTAWIFTKKGEQYFTIKENYNQCRNYFLSYPNWILKFNIGNWIKRSRVWGIWKCH